MRYHLWFRGQSKPIEAELDNLLEHVKIHVFLAGIGESGDRDSLYVFEGNKLYLQFAPVHDSVGYNTDEWEALELRVFNVFSEKEELIATEVFDNMREIEEGEIGDSHDRQ